jgi:RimJ/RimL family protein N-acetyltransferase
MKIPTFDTQRLRLRPFSEADVAPLHRILTQEGMLKYFPSPAGPPIEKVEKFIRNQI